eukprot:GHVQ01034399.1.p1 GENE.GHVQ01034399.1~~GHVQ01034399.1.p1  ORF type:complete len:336 (-),score=21.40 GHVQ01034399.1:640-1647(-)
MTKKAYHALAEPGETYNAFAGRMRLRWIAQYDQEHPNTKGIKTVVFGLTGVGFQGSIGNALLIGFYNGKLSACQNHEFIAFLWSYQSPRDKVFVNPEFKDIDFYYDETLPHGHPDKCLDFLFSQTPITFCMTVDMMRLLSKLCGTGWDDQDVLERVTSVEYYMVIGEQIQEDHWLGVIPQHKPNDVESQLKTLQQKNKNVKAGRRRPARSGPERTPTNGGGRKILELPAPAPPMVPWPSKARIIDNAGTSSVSPDYTPVLCILSFGLIIAVLYKCLPAGILESLWRRFIWLIKHLTTSVTSGTETTDKRKTSHEVLSNTTLSTRNRKNRINKRKF